MYQWLKECYLTVKGVLLWQEFQEVCRRMPNTKKVLKKAKGYYGARSKVYRVAKQAVIKAGQYAYRDRRQRRRQFRRLWIVRINAEARNNGLSYSQFINGLNKAGIEIDRKVLSDIAIFDKDAFAKIAEQAKAGLTQ